MKTRLGFTEIDEWRGWLTHILQQDIVNLSIHLRTREEMSKVDAHWELIPEIKKLRDEIAPNTLLTINGDIPDRQTGLKLAEEYGVDGIMIGRGFFRIRLRLSRSRRSTVARNCWICCGCIWTFMINTQDRHHARSARFSGSSKSTSAASAEPEN